MAAHQPVRLGDDLIDVDTVRDQRFAVDGQDELRANRAVSPTPGRDGGVLYARVLLRHLDDNVADVAELVVVVAEDMDAGVVARPVAQAAVVVRVGVEAVDADADTGIS